MDFDTQEFLKHSQDKNDSFKIFHLNIRSFSANVLQLDHFLSLINHKIDIIILSEAWINNVEAYKSLFPDYEIQYSNKTNKAGGVIVLTYRNNIKIFDTRINFLDEADSISLLFSYKSQNSQSLIALYRSPSSNFWNFMNSLNEAVKADKNNLYLLAGDFNVDMNSYTTDPKSENLYDTLLEYGLIPVIKTPTRPKSSTVIDQMFFAQNKTRAQDITSGNILANLTDHNIHYAYIANRPILNKNDQPINHKKIFFKELNQKKFVEDLKVRFCDSSQYVA